MLIGYARVSTRRQRLNLQHKALEAAKCDLMISEWLSGGGGIGQGLTAAINACGKGDLLVVWKLDRLGRNLAELMCVIKRLRGRGAGLPWCETVARGVQGVCRATASHAGKDQQRAASRASLLPWCGTAALLG